MKTKLITISLLSLGIFFLTGISVSAEHSILGQVEGAGTYFEITDSEYLNISLEGSEEITVLLESAPKTISLYIEASESVSSTALTISNLEPNKTYYKFEDSYKNEIEFITDENRKYSWIQDLTQHHHIWFQEERGTIFIPEQCSTYGTWDSGTSTCTLTQDLTESVEITANGITLDCDDHGISAGYNYGMYINDRQNIIIKHCLITDSFYGISLIYSSQDIITHNTFSGNRGPGLNIAYSSYNEITDNIIELNSWYGIRTKGAKDNLIKNNFISLNSYDGINIDKSASIPPGEIEVSRNTIIENTIRLNKGYGIEVHYCSDNYIYHNNFIDNRLDLPDSQSYQYPPAFWDNGYPSGGNYWSDYTGVDQYSGPNQDQSGSDGIGDAPATFPYYSRDRYPFMVENGWEITGRIRPDAAVALAGEVIGKDYRLEWGNSFTKGYYQDFVNRKFIFLSSEDIEYLDCSGLSFWSFNRAYYNGSELTKTEFENRPLYYEGSNMQYLGNIDRELELTKEDLRPGDLLFFDTWDRNTETYGQDGIVDHVAMYIGLYEGEQYAVEHAHRGKDNIDNAEKISVTTVDGLISYYETRFGEGAFVDFGRVIDRRVVMKITGHSPIDLIVTDPDGETIYENIGAREVVSELGDVGDSLTMGYMVYDIDGDGELDDIIASPERKIGTYQITVVPEPDALPTDTYSLEIEVLINGEVVTTVLAEDVPISEIPDEPYVFESVPEFVPASVEIKPETLNLSSEGIFTAFIQLPEEHNIADIDVDTVESEGAEAIRGNITGNNTLMVKFNREDLVDVSVGEEVEVTITGELADGTRFKGIDVIRVIKRGKKK